MNHPDNPLEDWPIPETDLSRSFDKLKSFIREEEKRAKTVKEIINPPNPLQPPHSIKQ